MKIAIRVVGNILGTATMFLLLYGSLTVIFGRQFGLPEITFLMFACFIGTVLIVMSQEKDRGKEKVQAKPQN